MLGHLGMHYAALVVVVVVVKSLYHLHTECSRTVLAMLRLHTAFQFRLKAVNLCCLLTVLPAVLLPPQAV